MRPHKLTISGFLSYGGSEVVDFDKLSSAGGLFLIQGATGAGKTSILDAISFALYGRLPGKRSGATASTYRSDFAAIDTPTFVELDVTLRNGRYMIYRSPAYEVPKQRGTGMTPKKSETKIKKWVNGDWEPYTGNAAESGGDLSGLIGLQPEQFFKLILLPQGDFAKFLHSSSKERQAILEDLFSDEIDKFKKLTDHFWDYYNEVKKIDEESARAVLGEIQKINQTFSTVYTGPERDLTLADPNSADLAKTYISALSKQKDQSETDVAAAEAVKAEALEKEQAAKTIYENSSKVIEAKDKFAAAEKALKKWREDNIEALPAKIKDETVLKEINGQVEKLNGEVSAIKASNEKIDDLLDLRDDVDTKADEVDDAKSALEAHDASVSTDVERIKTLELTVNSDNNPGQEQAENKLAIKALEDQITLAGNWAKSEKAINSLKSELEILIATRDKALSEYESAQASFDSAQASVLAEKLSAGAPCPVCGSPDHPAPAKKTGAVTKEAVKKALDLSNESAKKVAGKEGELESEIAKSAEYASGKDLDAEKLKGEVLALNAKDGEFKSAIDALAKAKTELQKLKANQEKQTEAREKLSKALTAAEAALKSAKSSVTKAEKALKIEADVEVETVDVKPLETKVSALRKLSEKFEPLFDSFKSTESAYKAVATSGAEEVPDIVAAKQVREAAEANLRELSLKLGRVKTLESELKKIEKALRVAEDEQKKAKLDVKRYEDIAKYMKGQAGDKITLVSYFLGQRLFQILDAANKRMQTMTRGQFTLQTNHEKKGSGQNYLSIAVLDSWNNGVRDATALSGGETFTASLALAFGLADVVTSEAGGQSLDSLFIDEGFGSLDPDYLQAVMQSLEELRESGRVIGLISHVEEMKQRISMQLLVSKDGTKGTQVKIIENIGG